MTVPLCAVVLASRGGAPLATALDALAWAGERAILDLAGVVRTADVPVGVHLERRANDLSTLGTLPWLLLLAEHEEAMPEFPAAADAAMAAGGRWPRRRDAWSRECIGLVCGTRIST